ncbi:hypothetical protein [Salinivibrio sp. IB282]|uniref:hypothetical protein n=1 Tax=Salinivibrio sp. IB282 TaxID=1766122 RepID=UPI0009885829|nr:hypothetical protein [Salinivibrio sp. IB282]OOE57754.1 hypothetical protein BZG14_14825 [Salinivibrio sp. IB282]
MQTQTITVTTASQMQDYADQVWALLVASYAHVKGGLHYTNKPHMLAQTQRWQLVVRGKRVIAAILFKAKRGWKLVAMAACRRAKSAARAALKRLICGALPNSWMELSERAEHFVMLHCHGHQYLIHASLVSELLNKSVRVDEADSYHYVRDIAGIPKAKIIVGTPARR